MSTQADVTDLECVLALLRHGADASLRDVSCSTAGGFALKRGSGPTTDIGAVLLAARDRARRTPSTPTRPRRLPTHEEVSTVTKSDEGPARGRRLPVWKSNCRGASPPLLNHDLTPSTRRHLDGVAVWVLHDSIQSSGLASPRNDLVKNCRVHPTHWLIFTQADTKDPKTMTLNDVLNSPERADGDTTGSGARRRDAARVSREWRCAGSRSIKWMIWGDDAAVS